MHLSIFRATNVRLSHTYKQNANSVTLEFMSDDGTVEVTIYDLPCRVTDKFEALADATTTRSRVEVA